MKQLRGATPFCDSLSLRQLAERQNVGYTHNVQVLHSDNRKRVTLPDPARPKDSWIPEVVGHNQIMLTRVEKPTQQRAKLVRKGGLLLLSSKRPITWEETRKAMDEFPSARPRISTWRISPRPTA